MTHDMKVRSIMAVLIRTTRISMVALAMAVSGDR
jgi:hypothetical protein